MNKEIKQVKINIEGKQVELETKKLSLVAADVKVLDEEKGIVEMYVSKFGNVDSNGDIVLPGAFAKSIARFNEDGRFPKGIHSHMWDKPIAKTLEMREDAVGLYIKAQFVLSVQQAREDYELIKAGVTTDFSFGYFTEDSEYDSEGNRLLKSVIIYEWSPVLVGANPDTEVLAVKSIEVEEESETPEEGEEKGAVADLLNARNNPNLNQERRLKWLRVNKLDKVYYSFMHAYMDDRVAESSFDELVKEFASLVVDIKLTDEERGQMEKSIKEEMKTVLAKVTEAKEALEESLAEEEETSMSGESDTGIEEASEAEERKVVKLVQNDIRAAATAVQNAAKTLKIVIKK